MVLVLFLLLICAVVVVITGLVSATTCRISYLNPHGQSLHCRTSSQYFWIGLGLAYALWGIFFALSLYEHAEEVFAISGAYTPARSLALFLFFLSPVMFVVCIRQAAKQIYCTQPIWQIITIFIIAIAAVVPVCQLLVGLSNYI
jgi:hypothetical protein